METENAILIFRGDTMEGNLQLKTFDSCDPDTKSPYDLTGVTEIKLRFKGDSGTVELLLSATEVSITNAVQGLISFSGSTVKSVLLKTGKNLPIDAVLTLPSTKIKTFENTSILEVRDRAAG